MPSSLMRPRLEHHFVRFVRRDAQPSASARTRRAERGRDSRCSRSGSKGQVITYGSTSQSSKREASVASTLACIPSSPRSIVDACCCKKHPAGDISRVLHVPPAFEVLPDVAS